MTRDEMMAIVNRMCEALAAMDHDLSELLRQLEHEQQASLN